MTVTVASMIAATRRTLIDTDSSNYRWSDATLLEYLNDGQVEIARLKPDSSVTVSNIPLSSGIEQILPVGAIRLIKLICNMGISGTTPGRAINLADLAEFSLKNPSWASETSSTTAMFYMYDTADPKRFYVSPPANGQYVKAVYSSVPASATSGGNITIGDEYKTALIYWICFKAYLEDSISPDTNKAMTFNQLFLGALQSGKSADAEVEPFGGTRNANN